MNDIERLWDNTNVVGGGASGGGVQLYEVAVHRMRSR